MKIAITGHTKGIGLACAGQLNDYDVTGYSRSNGWNISESQKLVEELINKDYDVFINNAYMDIHQELILNLLFPFWQDKDKCIITIGSYVIDYPPIKKQHEQWPYKEHKVSLAKTFRKLSKTEKICRLHLINPGPTDTEMLQHYNNITKMDPSNISKMVKLMIENPRIKEAVLYD